MNDNFPPPNYTQTPNVIFDDLLPAIGDASLRVLLVIVRETFGYHRKKTRLSLTTLQKKTGLSRQGVINGVDGLGDLVIKTTTGRVNTWELNVADSMVNEIDYQIVNEIDSNGQSSGLRSVKENIKEKESSPGEKRRSPDIVLSNDLRKKAEDFIIEITGLDPPDLSTQKSRKAAGSSWFVPVRKMLLSAGGDFDVFARRVQTVVTRMNADSLTISAPRSLMSIYNDVARLEKSNGNQIYERVYK